MKLFTQKDSDLIIDLIRFSLKTLILIVLFLVTTAIPGTVISLMIYCIDSQSTTLNTNMILSIWVLSMIISIVGLLVHYSNLDDAGMTDY